MISNTLSYLARYVRYNHIVRAFYRAGSANRILVNSVPKSGTHLVMKALELTPGIQRAPIHLGRQRLGLLPWAMLTCPSMRHVILPQYRSQVTALRDSEDYVIAIDSDSPFFVGVQSVQRILELVQPGWFAMGHLPYSAPLARLVEQLSLKMIVVIRDPRDVVVSHANYLARKSTHYMNPLYKALTPKERIMTSIEGVTSTSSHPALCNIRERFDGIIAWNAHPNAYVTRFEKLIGPQGHGSREAQLSDLRGMLRHLGLEMTDNRLRMITGRIYGGTRTFTRGQWGRWRADFDEDHRQACKELIGDLLVELGYEQDLHW